MRIAGWIHALAAALLLGLAALPTAASATIELNVDQGVVQPLPIAIPAFAGLPVGAQIVQVVNGNLEGSGLFRPLDAGTFTDRNLNVNVQPRFDSWKAIHAQALVNGSASIDASGRLVVDIRIWDVFAEQELFNRRFRSTPDNWRRIAHQISDAIYERLTGEHGYFDTRVVFVAESGPRGARVRRLAIMDQDGANPSYLTDGSALVFTPRFSSNSQEITYMALRPTGASLYLLNIVTGRQEALGHFTGMVFAPRFSPDGRRVAFSSERGGNSDIYVMDLATRQATRITADPAIDTSPSFAPDGAHIVFNSDRGGSPQLYVMNADGSNVRRISYGGGRYTTPVWSPTTNMIAFTKQEGGAFHIGVMNADGSGERLLTTSYLDEGPTWAPNGRVIMFSRETQGGGARLWTVDLTGRVTRAAAYPSGASDPAWSPSLN